MASVEESLESVAIGLLTLEVNTIKKCGMSAQKMPDVPIALHSIVDAYNDYLSRRGYGVTDELLTWATNRIKPPNPPPAQEDWFKKLMTWRPGANDAATAMASVDLTNGAPSFEALRWAAEAGVREDNEKKRAKDTDCLPEEEHAVIARIMANCRQLTPVVLGLQTAYEKANSPPPPDKLSAETPLLVGGSLEQTARACFNGDQKLHIPLNVAVLVRKVWDIGTETVLAQTSVQVDGDVVTRVSPMMLAEQRDFLLGLHNTSLLTGLAQWKALFDLAAQLIGGLAQKLFKSL